jgi:3-oxoacyl-[acyl-carrier protein] reductase
MELGLAGKVAWVVGATGTLGAQIAHDLAGEGARVFCSGRNRDRLAALAADLPSAVPVPVDVTDRASVDDAARTIIEQAGRLDILVNTTAVSVFGDFLTLGDAAWEEVLQAKWLAYVRTIRAVIPQMRAQGSGCIICISGKGGRTPHDVHLPGCSANAALNLLVRGLAEGYGRNGVRILAVAPGVIASPRLGALQVASSADDPDRAKANMTASNALGRLGTAEEVSAAVLFAVSNPAGFLNGCVLEVDGG